MIQEFTAYIEMTQAKIAAREAKIGQHPRHAQIADALRNELTILAQRLSTLSDEQQARMVEILRHQQGCMQGGEIINAHADVEAIWGITRTW